MILDEVGLLKHAYRLGTIAVVGGGWGAGVHNTLEPAAFGLPIAVGPATEGFREIDALQAEGALHVCHASSEMADLLQTWMAPESTSILKEKGHRQPLGDGAKWRCPPHRRPGVGALGRADEALK